MSSSDSSTDSSSSSDIDIKGLKLDDSEINILLLGGTGVGKSTFINSIGNYLTLKYFSEAEKEGLVKVIPAVFSIKDKNNKYRTVQVGHPEDNNEVLETGESCTQNVKTYTFLIYSGRVKVRLIDTPGMVDTRGIEQDEINRENIINYISSLTKIHAICVLYKPDQVRKNVYFDYCLYQVLSLFDKEAAKNIFFFFCHTSVNSFTPGDTLEILKVNLKHIESVTGVKIPLDEGQNIFCFDNEAFRYLSAVEKHVQFEESAKEKFIASWRHSAKQCWKFIKLIERSKPYNPSKLAELQLARKSIAQLSMILSDISSTMENNKYTNDRWKDKLINEEKSVSQLKDKHMWYTDVIEKAVAVPLLVCTSCAELYRVKGVDKYHYRNICHYCHEISETVTKNEVGCPDILRCANIDFGSLSCTQCRCSFFLHKFVQHTTSLQEIVTSDEKADTQIAIRESLLDTYRSDIDGINMVIVEHQSEYDAIKKFCTRVAGFIKKYAIITFSDSYKQYILYLIKEKQHSSTSSVKTSIDDLRRFVKEYTEAENVFKDAVPTLPTPGLNYIECEELFNLFKLNHFGTSVKKWYHEQKQNVLKSSKVKEYEHTDYFVSEREKKYTRQRESTNQKTRNRNYEKGARPQRSNYSQSNNNRPPQAPGTYIPVNNMGPYGQGYNAGNSGQGVYNRNYGQGHYAGIPAQGYNAGPPGQGYYAGPSGQGYYAGPSGQGYHAGNFGPASPYYQNYGTHQPYTPYQNSNFNYPGYQQPEMAGTSNRSNSSNFRKNKSVQNTATNANKYNQNKHRPRSDGYSNNSRSGSRGRGNKDYKRQSGIRNRRQSGNRNDSDTDSS